MRARRLGIGDEEISLVADDDVDAIVALVERVRPKLLIVDSIQAVSVPEIPSAAGGVAQVRESASRLVRLAKTTGTAVVLVGHVTKEGGLAGPKLLEHMVDVVLYLEGDPDRGFRVLRSIKNRYGATHVSGMFDMRSEGLLELDDPSKVFLEGWQPEVPGTVIYPAVEGRRSILVEIQALVSPTNQPQPRRSIRGLDPTRVNQVLAVLHRHAGIPSVRQGGLRECGWRLADRRPGIRPPGGDRRCLLCLRHPARANWPPGARSGWRGRSGRSRSRPAGSRSWIGWVWSIGWPRWGEHRCVSARRWRSAGLV